MLGRVVFGPDDDFQKHESQGALPALIRLQRQVSYFGDREGMSGLQKHIADDDISCQILQMLWDERSEEHVPYKPFREWPNIVDPSFKDLILRLTNLDPMKRIRAREALEHPWLTDLWECLECVLIQRIRMERSPSFLLYDWRSCEKR